MSNMWACGWHQARHHFTCLKDSLSWNIPKNLKDPGRDPNGTATLSPQSVSDDRQTDRPADRQAVVAFACYWFTLDGSFTLFMSRGNTVTERVCMGVCIWSGWPLPNVVGGGQVLEMVSGHAHWLNFIGHTIKGHGQGVECRKTNKQKTNKTECKM